MMPRLGLWLFHGGERFLVERAFNQAWEKLTGDLDSDLDRELLDPTAPAEEVLQAVSSVGFFSPGRVVGIREWRLLSGGAGRRKTADADEVDRAAELLAQMPADAGLVLSAAGSVPAANPLLKLARERGQAQDFPKLRFGDIGPWVARRVRELGLKLDPSGQRLLVESVGDDLRLLDSELGKLELYAAGRALGVDEVRELVPDSAEHQIWDLTDALLVDPGRAAVELDRALAAGEPPGRLSYMLIRHLRLVLAASDAPRGAAGIKALTDALSGEGRPVNEYTVKKALSQAQGMERGRLEELYRRAGAVEAASRRGDIDDVSGLRLLVLSAAGR
jgi:DNA polymerase-3 subunit delta